jgi:peptidoglycan/xylan/chitin deacetylase (PgdA/CDA1 family)
LISSDKKILPDILWRESDEKVYLTFDDGPDPEVTPKVLDLLDQFNAHATFFLIGEKVTRHPDIVLQIKKRGHAIGNHSFRHPRMLGMAKEQILEELNLTDDAILKITGGKPRLFRPPYGLFGKDLLQALNLTQHRMVLWSASAKDYQAEATPEIIETRLLKIVKSGKIILLHDGHRNSPNTLTALGKFFPTLAASGLLFSALEN